MSDWTGKHVLILGAARQGLALARWMNKHGAHVTLSDKRGEVELEPARRSLVDIPVAWVLGGHPLELLESTDVLCLSGGVPLNLPIVQEAIKRGIPLSNDTQVFMEAVPCKTVGITGSAGKTTTTALLGKMAEFSMENKPGRAYTGGNIGDPLINYVDEMNPEDIAILEISSFQLDQMSISASVAAVLNITPNHLDRHGTMEAYTAAKARLLDFQNDIDIAVLGRDDPGAWNLRGRVRGKLLSFGLSNLPADQSGAYVRDELYHLRDGNAYMLLPIQNAIHLRGDHNRQNVLAAITCGHAAGLSLDAILEAIENFHGVPHRLELVRELHGVKWYNDSIATTPERAIAAVHTFDEPILLILGGRDKDLPWDELSALAHKQARHVVVFGEAGDLIMESLEKGGTGGRRAVVHRCRGLQEAVQKSAELAETGDVVLLSPGGTSFDEFIDFAERGERFRSWVQELS
jgi:UDP-N-acetylmuramoylalanine--D-glutamate ligase